MQRAVRQEQPMSEPTVTVTKYGERGPSILGAGVVHRNTALRLPDSSAGIRCSPFLLQRKGT